MTEIFVCGTPQVHHNTLLSCEPTWTVTVVLPVEQFLPSLQRRCRLFFTLNSQKQQRYVDATIPDMEEEEEEGRVFGGGGGTTTATTMMATVMATDRSGGGGTHVAGVRRPRSGSTVEGGGERTTTNAIRLPRKTRLAPLTFKKTSAATTPTERGSTTGIPLTTTTRRTTQTTTTLGRGERPPLKTGMMGATEKRTASTSTTAEAETGCPPRKT